jgi:hypothetical protein
MNRLSASQQQNAGAPLHAGGILQRKCDCGNHTVAGGECAECSKKEMSLQRATQNSESDTQNSGGVPAIVHDVLRSTGQPLDTQTRAFMEPRFAHDFSRVRVHTDGRATKSALAVNALAYTVGHDVVFGAGQYRPSTTQGQGLLAHELAHVVQQREGVTRKASLTIGEKDDPAEQEANAAAIAVTNQQAATLTTGYDSSFVRRQPAPTYRVTPTVPAAAAAVTGCGSFAVKMTPFVTGVEGTVAFTPDAKTCPTCALIRLVQIVRVFEKAGVDYVFPGSEANRENVKTKEDKAKGVEPNFFVDHYAGKCSEGKKCSIYYRDHAPNSKKSHDGSNDGVTPKAASLWDRPSAAPNFSMNFETCARCDTTGAYLKCVNWGFTSDAKGKATNRATSEKASPSATFTAALATFDKFYKN